MKSALVLAVPLMIVLSAGAGADQVAPLRDPLTLKACGECHMAFQPDFLPARSWRRIMETLDNHYGDTATVSADKAAHIRKVLEDGAGDRTGGKVARRFMRWVAPDGIPMRITENPAFTREHDFPAREWSRPEVKSRANCPACHRRAEQGDYEE